MFGSVPSAFAGATGTCNALDLWAAFYSEAAGGALVDRISVYCNVAGTRIGYRMTPSVNVPASSFDPAPPGPIAAKVYVERGPIRSRLVCGAKLLAVSDPLSDLDPLIGPQSATATMQFVMLRPIYVPYGWCLQFATPYSVLSGIYNITIGWTEPPDPETTIAGG